MKKINEVKQNQIRSKIFFTPYHKNKIIMLLILFVILLAVFVSALYVVYILLKPNHRIISTIMDVLKLFN